MTILVVFCHPSKKSFTYQVLNNLLKGLKASGNNILISNLYEMNFQTDMSEAEYEREGFERTERPLPKDVIVEQQKIQQSDCIIFLYPLWWSDCPAKLKGWFDRVYSVGYAYGYDKAGKRMITMKKQKLGLVICTAGHTNQFLDETGITESMRKIMLEDRLGPRFEKKHMVILGGTLELDKVREKHITTAYDIGKNINYQTIS